MSHSISLKDQLAELEQYHKTLDQNVKRGYTNYLDDINLSKLKQEKLQVKQSINLIKTQLGL